MLPPYFLICLFPLGVYLLALANVNRRERPTMIGGCWDAAFLSFGLSGILLWTGPAILGTFYERGLLPGSAELENRRFQQIWTIYPWVWTSYYVLVVAGQGLMIFGRRDKTAVYNVDAAALERLVVRVLSEMGYRVLRRDGPIVFDKADGDAEVKAGAVDVEAFAPLRHATLSWSVHDSPLRRAVERDVGQHLAEAATDDNPSVSWLLGVSGAIFGFVILGAAMVILVKLYPFRGW